MNRKVVFWIKPNQPQEVHVDQIPGAIAEAFYPLPVINEEADHVLIDKDAVERVTLERKHTVELRKYFPNLFATGQLSISQIKSYLANQEGGLQPELRYQFSAPKPGNDKGANGYESSLVLLDGCWDKSWDSLPDRQKSAWREIAYLNNIDSEYGPCEPVALYHWDAISPIQRGTICAQYDYQNNPDYEADRLVAWSDTTTDAGMWFGLKSVTPREAAALLCRFNPQDESCNPMEDSTDETSPSDFKRLLRVFDDLATDSQLHTLKEWLAIARDKQLKYHSWIDEYENAVVLVQIDGGQNASSDEPPVNANPIIRRKRNALVKELEGVWPTIVRDLSDASRTSSGLSLAAKLGNTFWDVTNAVTWAVERGKITKQKATSSVATNPDSVFAATLRQLFNI